MQPLSPGAPITTPSISQANRSVASDLEYLHLSSVGNTSKRPLRHLGVLNNWKSLLAHTWPFASSSRYLCWAHWWRVNVLPGFLLNYKVCKVTVRRDDFEEWKQEVLKINWDRASKIGVLSLALPKVFGLTLNKPFVRPFYLPTLKSSACAGSPLLHCQQRSQWRCAPRWVKS